jgi:hypothetical protein
MDSREIKTENCEDSSHDRASGFSYMKEAEFAEDYMPSENEPYMNPGQLAYFRRKLLSWRKELVGQLGVNLQSATFCLEAQHWLESGKDYERSIFQ